MGHTQIDIARVLEVHVTKVLEFTDTVVRYCWFCRYIWHKFSSIIGKIYWYSLNVGLLIPLWKYYLKSFSKDF